MARGKVVYEVANVAGNDRCGEAREGIGRVYTDTEIGTSGSTVPLAYPGRLHTACIAKVLRVFNVQHQNVSSGTSDRVEERKAK